MAIGIFLNNIKSLSNNCLWLVVILSTITLFILFIVFCYTISIKTNKNKETKQQERKNDFDEANLTNKIEEIKENPKTISLDSELVKIVVNPLLSTKYAKNQTSTIELLNEQKQDENSHSQINEPNVNQAYNAQSKEDILSKLILDNEKNLNSINEIKQMLSLKEEKAVQQNLYKQSEDLTKSELSERLSRIESFLKNERQEDTSSELEARQNAKIENLYNELSSKIASAEKLIKENIERGADTSSENESGHYIKLMIEELGDKIDQVEKNINSNKVQETKSSVDERQDAELKAAIDMFNDKIEKAEANLSGKSATVGEDKFNDYLISSFKTINERLDKMEDLFKEQNETILKKELDNTQRELEKAERDKFMEKLVEKFASKDNFLSNEELLEKLVAKEVSRQKDTSKFELVEKSQANIEFKQADKIAKEETVSVPTVPLNKFEDKILKNTIEVLSSGKLTLKQAYAKLSTEQKRYFDLLKIYAEGKPLARTKEVKASLNIGVGTKHYIQLGIKKGIVIASFNNESEELMMLRLNGKKLLKPEPTKIKVVDRASYETAKQMVDIRVEQVSRELEAVRDLRREKQKQRYEESKKS